MFIECLLYASIVLKHLTYILSLNLNINVMIYDLLISLFYRWGNWIKAGVRKLLNATQLKVGEPRSEHKQPDVRDYDQLTLHLGSKESGIRVPQK